MLGAAKTSANGPVRADGMDRLAIGLEVAQRVLGGQRAFAEHVERIAVVRVVALARARQRFVDGAAHHELVAHDPHRLAHGQADHRLADAPDQALEGAVHVALGVVGQVDQVAGQHQAPGRGVDQHRVGLAEVALPVGLAELVADQLVGGVLVGDAQQRLGHAHQQHAFLAAEVVLAHEGFDRALVLGARARTRRTRSAAVAWIAALVGSRQCRACASSSRTCSVSSRVQAAVMAARKRGRAGRGVRTRGCRSRSDQRAGKPGILSIRPDRRRPRCVQSRGARGRVPARDWPCSGAHADAAPPRDWPAMAAAAVLGLPLKTLGS